MHSIKDLENHFGLNYHQVYDRLRLLRSHFGDRVKGGQNSKYWLTDSGFKIFDRMLELEKNGHGPKSAVSQIKEELAKPDTTSQSPEPKSAKVDEKYVQSLENQVSFLQTEVERLHGKLDRLLPSGESKGILRRIWQRIW